MEVAFAGCLAMLVAAALVLQRRRARVQRTLVVPLEQLLGTVTALRAGRLSARAPATDVPELAELGAELESMAGQLTSASADAAARQRRLARLAYRFETVVRVGRRSPAASACRTSAPPSPTLPPSC